MKMLAKAIALAAKAFEDKVDKGGQPYILHCLRVMNGVSHCHEHVMCAAVLHDLIEDCGDKYSLDSLREMGFHSEVIFLIGMVTHNKKEEDYDTYIKRIASFGGGAKQIKLADLKDNSDITRLKGLRKKDFDRMERYHRAWIYLQD